VEAPPCRLPAPPTPPLIKLDPHACSPATARAHSPPSPFWPPLPPHHAGLHQAGPPRPLPAAARAHEQQGQWRQGHGWGGAGPQAGEAAWVGERGWERGLGCMNSKSNLGPRSCPRHDPFSNVPVQLSGGGRSYTAVARTSCARHDPCTYSPAVHLRPCSCLAVSAATPPWPSRWRWAARRRCPSGQWTSSTWWVPLLCMLLTGRTKRHAVLLRGELLGYAC